MSKPTHEHVLFNFILFVFRQLCTALEIAKGKLEQVLAKKVIGNLKLNQGLDRIFTTKAFDLISKSSCKDKTMNEIYKAMKTPEFRKEIADSALGEMSVKEVFMVVDAPEGFVSMFGLKSHESLKIKDMLLLNCPPSKAEHREL